VSPLAARRDTAWDDSALSAFHAFSRGRAASVTGVRSTAAAVRARLRSRITGEADGSVVETGRQGARRRPGLPQEARGLPSISRRARQSSTERAAGRADA